MTTRQHQWQDDENRHKQHNEHDQQHQIKQLHGTIMVIAWLVLLQLAIWSHYFRSIRISIYVHIICVSLISILSSVGMGIMLASQGFEVVRESFFHQTIGFIVIVGLLPAILIGGIASLILRNNQNLGLTLYTKIKKLHKIYGWITIAIVKLPLLTGLADDQGLIGVLIVLVDVGIFVLYFYKKQNHQKMENIMINQSYLQIPQRKKLENLEKGCKSLDEYNTLYTNLCFIFCNYIYEIYSVLSYHPGGQVIIENVRNRQIDRFIYGMQTLQKYSNYPQIKPYSHNINFLNLSSSPYSKITIPQPYIQIKIKTICSVSNIYENLQSHMFIIYLRLKESNKGTGYTSVTQLGRYRAFLVHGISRLYSNVEFLRQENIKFMDRLMKGQNCDFYKKKQITNQNETEIEMKRINLINLQQKLINSESQFTLTLPLFIKQYQHGKFTQFLQHRLTHNNNQNQNANANANVNKIEISQSRGFGLGFTQNNSIRPGVKQRIVIFTAGTGLNPFCDLIDLLYKSFLISQNHEDSQFLIRQNPILQQNQLQKYVFIFYIAVDSLSFIHPITLFQLQSLSKNNKITVYLKSKQTLYSKLTLSSLQYVNKLSVYLRFELLIQKQLNLDKNTKFLMCGPGNMAKNIVQKLQNCGVQANKYRII